jgi:hypothetical protein
VKHDKHTLPHAAGIAARIEHGIKGRAIGPPLSIAGEVSMRGAALAEGSSYSPDAAARKKLAREWQLCLEVGKGLRNAKRTNEHNLLRLKISILTQAQKPIA